MSADEMRHVGELKESSYRDLVRADGIALLPGIADWLERLRRCGLASGRRVVGAARQHRRASGRPRSRCGPAGDRVSRGGPAREARARRLPAGRRKAWRPARAIGGRRGRRCGRRGRPRGGMRTIGITGPDGTSRCRRRHSLDGGPAGRHVRQARAGSWIDSYYHSSFTANDRRPWAARLFGSLCWIAVLLVASVLLVRTHFHTRDPDSALYVIVATHLADQPVRSWIAPQWWGGWNHEGPFREHPFGVFLLPALLTRPACLVKRRRSSLAS